MGGTQKKKKNVKKRKRRFQLSEKGRKIEAKLKDLVTKDILEHRRLGRKQVNSMFADLVKTKTARKKEDKKAAKAGACPQSVIFIKNKELKSDTGKELF